jgi:hypothetical protein
MSNSLVKLKFDFDDSFFYNLEKIWNKFSLYTFIFKYIIKSCFIILIIFLFLTKERIKINENISIV